MNEETTEIVSEPLQAALAEILLSVTETAGEAKDFLVAELPDVASQALLYYGVYEFLFFLIYLGTFIFCIQAARPSRWVAGDFLNERGSDITGRGAAGIAQCAGAVVSGLLLINQFEWLKIWLAPKLWLIEYASSLVK